VTKSYWRTESARSRRDHVQWPSPRQILRQVGIVALVGILWGSLLVGYLYLTGRPTEGSLSAESVAAVPAPTDTPRPRPTDTVIPALASTALGMSAAPSSSTSTATPEPTSVPATSTERAPTPTATSTPSPSPTETPAPSPLPTGTPAGPGDTPTPGDKVSPVSFANDVLPILERRCVQCHGGQKTEQGLSLKTYADALAGSWNGLVVEPGSANDSFLVQQIVSGKMPKKGPRLLPSEIQIIRDWIDAGALDN
jgi:hypothetical protein